VGAADAVGIMECAIAEASLRGDVVDEAEEG